MTSEFVDMTEETIQTAKREKEDLKEMNGASWNNGVISSSLSYSF